MTKVEDLDVLNLSEPDFLEMVVEKIGPLKKNENISINNSYKLF
jgi:hypothetical protein